MLVSNDLVIFPTLGRALGVHLVNLWQAWIWENLAFSKTLKEWYRDMQIALWAKIRMRINYLDFQQSTLPHSIHSHLEGPYHCTCVMTEAQSTSMELGSNTLLKDLNPSIEWGYWRPVLLNQEVVDAKTRNLCCYWGSEMIKWGSNILELNKARKEGFEAA